MQANTALTRVELGPCPEPGNATGNAATPRETRTFPFGELHGEAPRAHSQIKTIAMALVGHPDG